MNRTCTPLQRRIGDEFRSRSKAICYGGGELSITQCHDQAGELEVWYRYEVGGVAYEVVLWVLQDCSVLIEVRSRKRKEFGKLLFDSKADLSHMMSNGSGFRSLPALHDRIAKLVDVFERISGQVLIATALNELKSNLAAIWRSLS